MKILVTGGSGFVGYNLVKRLSKQHELRVLVRKTSQMDKLRRLPVELSYGDLSDVSSLRRALEGREVVYHLAGALARGGVKKRL